MKKLIPLLLLTLFVGCAHKMNATVGTTQLPTTEDRAVVYNSKAKAILLSKKTWSNFKVADDANNFIITLIPVKERK